MRTWTTIILFAGLVRLLAPLGMESGASMQQAAHPSHLSRAEIDWNATTHSFECSLGIDAGEFESALSQLAGRRIDIEKHPQTDELAQEWLEDVFEIVDPKKKSRALTWVGMELDGAEVWLYFECKTGGKLSEHRIANRAFFDAQPYQLNFARVTIGEHSCDLLFNAERPEHSLSFVKDR